MSQPPSTAQITQLLLRLVCVLEECGYTLPLICRSCGEELLLICPECEAYDGKPEEECPSAEEHRCCSSCERATDKSHDACCNLGVLLHEANETIRSLEG